MNVYLNENYEDEFFLKYVPMYLVDSISSHDKEPSYINMDSALKSRYDVDMDEFIDALSVLDMRCGDINGFVRIGIPYSARIKGRSLDEIARFIDDGTLDVKGTKLFTNALLSLRKDVLTLYRLYTMNAR